MIHYSPATEFGRGITKEVLWYVIGPSTGDVTAGVAPPVVPVLSWASPDTAGSSGVMGVLGGWALRPLSPLTPAPPSFAHSRLEPQRSSFSLELVTVAAGWRERERDESEWGMGEGPDINGKDTRGENDTEGQTRTSRKRKQELTIKGSFGETVNKQWS